VGILLNMCTSKMRLECSARWCICIHKVVTQNSQTSVNPH